MAFLRITLNNNQEYILNTKGIKHIGRKSGSSTITEVYYNGLYYSSTTQDVDGDGNNDTFNVANGKTVVEVTSNNSQSPNYVVKDLIVEAMLEAIKPGATVVDVKAPTGGYANVTVTT